MQKNVKILISLIRGGLWDNEVRLLQFDDIDYLNIYRLAQEQAVVGLVASGIEHVIDVKVPQEVALQFAGDTLQLEQRNISMNYFISVLIDKMRAADIFALLVKGQGIAQCYSKPLWRASGDVDFLLSRLNYEAAKDFLIPLANSIGVEEEGPLHQSMIIEPWEVELHGSLHSGLYPQLDKTLDDVQEQLFEKGYVRTWRNGDVDICLPRADEDVVFVFAHILQHFFKGGIGLRQICDWSRLLWTYHDVIDKSLLKKRLLSMRIMSEWNAFASLAVNTLGMPEEAMPFYSSAPKWKRKAERVLDYIIESGNFGHNRENKYSEKKTLLGRKSYSFWRHTSDSVKHFFVFPKDSFLIWLNMVKTGFVAISKHNDNR